jgi:hypothetical protein
MQWSLLAAVLAVWQMASGMAEADAETKAMIARADDLSQTHIEKFRKEGVNALDPRVLAEARAVAGEALERASAAGERDLAAQAALALGTAARIQRDWDAALVALELAQSGPRETAYKAHLQSARAQMSRADRNLAAARQHLVAASGLANPEDPEAAYDLLSIGADLESYSGEYKAAAALGREALDAASRSSRPESKIYAYLAEADAFEVAAGLCEYTDTFDLCRRAAAAAGAAYAEVRAAAAGVGWQGLVAMIDGLSQNLEFRKQMIAMQEQGSPGRLGAVFSPTDKSDVIVGEAFLPGQAPTDNEIVGIVAAAADGDSARGVFLQAMQAQLQGQNETARALLHRAVDLLEVERSRLFDPDRRGSVIETRVEIYRDAFLHDLEARDYTTAFQTLERSRSRGLAELMASQTRREDHRLAALLKAEAELALAQTVFFEDVLAAATDPGIAPDVSFARDARLERDALLVAHGSSADGDWSPPTLDQLRAYVRAQDLAVMQFFATPTNLIVWALSPEGMDVRTVFLPRAVLEDKIVALLASVVPADGRSRDGTPAAPFPHEVAQELFLYLIAPFESVIGPDRRLVVIPQGALNMLPFEALVDPATGKFLIDKREITYAPNATFLLRKQPVPRLASMTLLVAENIPAIDSTIAGASWLKGANSPAFVEDLRVALAGADVLHLAAHGTHHPIEPLLSTIAFPGAGWGAPARELSAAELASFDLSETSLVVAAACESGEIRATIPNEALGLPWAFLAAGAQAAVVSRWEVNDVRTDAWMGAFYADLGRQLRSGSARPVATAARAASLALLADAETQHPYYWAAFQTFAP